MVEMRRHEIPRAPGFRVKRPVRGKWAGLSLAQKRQHIQDQLKPLMPMKTQPKITCLCGKTVPVMYAYRCYFCGAFWCPKCAGKHFDQAKKGKVSMRCVTEHFREDGMKVRKVDEIL